MIYSKKYSRSNTRRSGFTFVEMLVAVSLSSVCLGAGALALHSISTNAKRTTSITEIDIGTSTNQNFYGNATGKIRTYTAPNFGKLMFAQEMREKLAEDANRSSAIFCLPRSTPNTIRPETLTIPSGVTRPKLDTPEDFRAFLATVETTSTGIFTSEIRNLPPTDKPSTTIYLLGPSSDLDKIQVNAIYEIDFVTPSNLAGNYVSVRRYVGTALTHYYDIFYPPGDGDNFHPIFVAFEQISRQVTAEVPESTDPEYAAGNATDYRRFQIGRYAPFYMLWLPDPSINPYQQKKWTAADANSLARATYEHMAGKSAFSIVLPMFPSL